mgnify:CR=1 FL=1
MTAPPQRSVVEFDHNSEAFARDGDAILAELREQCPVAYTESHGGYWVLTSYAAAAAAMRDEDTFSSRHEPPAPDGFHLAGVNIPEAAQTNVLIEQDPPEWSPIRRILNPLFAPARVDELRLKFEAFTRECIDRVIETGHIDFVLDLANPVPAMATLAFLGLPLVALPERHQPGHLLLGEAHLLAPELGLRKVPDLVRLAAGLHRRLERVHLTNGCTHRTSPSVERTNESWPPRGGRTAEATNSAGPRAAGSAGSGTLRMRTKPAADSSAAR